MSYQEAFGARKALAHGEDSWWANKEAGDKGSILDNKQVTTLKGLVNFIATKEISLVREVVIF